MSHENTTPAPVAVPEGGFPRVRGYCPACGGESLFLAVGGYVTCSRLLCDDPVAPTEALGRRPEPVVAPLPSEPVVAPLPSEAGAVILATVHGQGGVVCERVPDGRRWRSTSYVDGRSVLHEDADIESWVRLVPEDDEDTVRVLDCGHIYRDGMRCTLTKAAHEEIPGLAVLHAGRT